MYLLFTRFPFTSTNGGAENQTAWLMDGLKQRGHAVSFLGSCPVLLKRTRELGIQNQQLTIGDPPVTKWGSISFLWRRAKMKRQLVEAFNRELEPRTSNLETIVMLSLTEKLLLTDIAVQKGIRVIWIEHDRIGRWLTWNPWLALLKRQSQLVTTVCVSELSRSMYLKLGWDPAKTVSIPNGVPIYSEQSQSSKLKAPAVASEAMAGRQSSKLRLGCLARLSPEKGVDVLIQALCDVPEADLLIVGHGPQEGYLRTLIEEDTRRIGLEEPRITLTAHVDDLEEFYDAIDALVLPSSDHDPFGLVAAEAMMRGIPVAVTDACGIAGYLHDGQDALVAQAGSAISLAACIRKLLDVHHRNRLAESGLFLGKKLLNLDAMVSRYEQLLQADLR